MILRKERPLFYQHANIQRSNNPFQKKHATKNFTGHYWSQRLHIATQSTYHVQFSSGMRRIDSDVDGVWCCFFPESVMVILVASDLLDCSVFVIELVRVAIEEN